MTSANSPAVSPSIWELPDAQAVTAVGQLLIGLPRTAVDDVLYRSVFAKYLVGTTTPPEPLYFAGSLSGGRYTPRRGPAGLYLSFDPATTPAELRAVVFNSNATLVTHGVDPIITVSVQTRVARVLDLTVESNLAALALQPADLVCDWEFEQEQYLDGRGSMPKTQMLALAAHGTGLFAGLKFPSARTSFGRNLVVFPDRLNAAVDWLQVLDSTGRWAQRLP